MISYGDEQVVSLVVIGTFIDNSYRDTLSSKSPRSVGIVTAPVTLRQKVKSNVSVISPVRLPFNTVTQ